MRNFIGAAFVWASLGLASAAVASEATYRLNLGSDDIEAVEFEANTAWLKLTPNAGKALHQITTSNQGDWLQISVDGTDAMTIRIYSPVDSGVVEVSRPSGELKAKLQNYR